MSRVLFLVFFYAIGVLSGIQYEGGSVFLQYDGQHYFNIAMSGYTHDYQYAFFPLFPLLIRFFGLFGVAIPGILFLNHCLTLLTGVALYYTGIKVMGKTSAESFNIARLWIFSPISIATEIVYSEALFVFLTVLTYYLYKRNHYVGAGVALGLSIATRNLGSALFFSIFIVMMYAFLKHKDWKQIANVFKLFVPATALAVLYPIYLFVKVGNWHYFLDVQYIYWGRIRTNIFEEIIRDISNLSETYLLFIFTYLALAVCVYVLYRGIKTREDPILILYLIFSIWIIFSTSREIDAVSSASFYRYLFGCSSVYLLLNRDLKYKPVIILSTVMCISTIIFFCGGAFLI